MALPASGYGLSSTHRHEFGIGIFQPLLLIDRDKPVSQPLFYKITPLIG
jgi:hypothetical protein